MERRVEHDQLGACWDDVIALVGFHKAHVNITLGLSSCKKRSVGGGVILEEREVSQGMHNESLKTTI